MRFVLTIDALLLDDPELAVDAQALGAILRRVAADVSLIQEVDETVVRTVRDVNGNTVGGYRWEAS